MRATIVIGFLLVAAAALSETVFRVEFHGNRQFSARELRTFLAGSKSIEWSEAEDGARLLSLQDSLVARDFLFARVDSSFREIDRRGRIVLHVVLREGNLARLESVEWLGDSARVDPAVFRRLLMRTGELFRWSNLEFDIQTLLSYFENAAHPFAEIEILAIEPNEETNNVSLRLVLRSGPRTTLEFLSFPGARQTRPSFLARETRLALGSLYRQERVEAARRRLARLEFIERADPPQILLDETGRTGLHFPVKEARSTRVDIVAGYLPASDSRDALMTGLANVEMLDLFGVGRKATIHWERPDRRVQAVEVAYREPWILGQPLALRLDFGQRIEDTLYVTRRFSVRAELDVTASIRLWGTVQREAVVADSVASVFLNLPDSRTTYTETGVSYDTRDHPTNPRAGVWFSTFAGTGWRQRDEAVGSEPAGSFRHHRGGIDTEIAQELLPFWIAYTGLHARALQTTEPQVLLPDLYRLGGARSLRGYREEQFLGSRIGWATAEIRYWLGPASRFFVFADAGGIYREIRTEDTTSESTLIRTAAGLGIRIGTDIGIWGFDYGIGQEDRLLNGKLHVSLLSTF